MALDTAQKRRSMVSFGGALYGERVPEATNFDSAADRGAEMWMYAGIAPDGGPGPVVGDVIIMFRTRHY